MIGVNWVGSIILMARGLLKLGGPFPWSAFLTWAGISALSFALAVSGAWWWSRWVAPRLWAWPAWLAWLGFLAIAFAFSWGAGFFRSSLALALIPQVMSPGQAQSLIVSQFACVFSGFLGLEWLGHSHQRWRQSLRLKAKLLGTLAEQERALVVEDDRSRRQVAEWLHGRVQGLLWATAALGQRAKQASPEDADAAWQGVRERLSEAAEEGLRPSWAQAQADTDLPTALDKLAASFRGLLAVQVDLDPAAAWRARAVRPEALSAALLVVEEGLLNAIKHGQAREARVQVQPEAEGLLLAFQVDGRPLKAFPPVGPGLGLGVLLPHLEALGARVAKGLGQPGGLWLRIELPWAAA